jgi:formylmethanofuran dehydrogenase subunit E
MGSEVMIEKDWDLELADVFAKYHEMMRPEYEQPDTDWIKFFDDIKMFIIRKMEVPSYTPPKKVTESVKSVKRPLPKVIICKDCGLDITKLGAVETKEDEWYCVPCYKKKEEIREATPEPKNPETQESLLLYEQRNVGNW